MATRARNAFVPSPLSGGESHVKLIAGGMLLGAQGARLVRQAKRRNGAMTPGRCRPRVAYRRVPSVATTDASFSAKQVAIIRPSLRS